MFGVHGNTGPRLLLMLCECPLDLCAGWHLIRFARRGSPVLNIVLYNVYNTEWMGPQTPLPSSHSSESVLIIVPFRAPLVNLPNSWKVPHKGSSRSETSSFMHTSLCLCARSLTKLTTRPLGITSKLLENFARTSCRVRKGKYSSRVM